MSAADFVPAHPSSLDELRRAAASCEGCDLFRRATQTVFGDGPPHPSLLLVGEQPGDKEDLAGEPFVGPAGRVLDQALERAGIDRADTYVTNAVKHFKWKPAGKVRLHQKPSRTEVVACHPWLQAELAQTRPRVVVALGATAAQALLGPSFRVSKDRGRVLVNEGGWRVVATVHPSWILRGDPAQREAALAGLAADLLVAAQAAAQAAPQAAE